MRRIRIEKPHDAPGVVRDLMGAPFRAVLAGESATAAMALITRDAGIPLWRLAAFGWRLRRALDLLDVDLDCFNDESLGSVTGAAIRRNTLSCDLDRNREGALHSFMEMIKVVGDFGDTPKEKRILNGRRATVDRIIKAHVDARLHGQRLPSHPFIDEIVEQYTEHKQRWQLFDRADLQAAELVPVPTPCDLLLMSSIPVLDRILVRKIFPAVSRSITSFERPGRELTLWVETARGDP